MKVKNRSPFGSDELTDIIAFGKTGMDIIGG